ncbi:MAG TPA: hypothetical protein VJ646_10015 [Candidatus Binatia bacterium]|nr:hypothetical protein [Candidatus Binatia bacterium]
MAMIAVRREKSSLPWLVGRYPVAAPLAAARPQARLESAGLKWIMCQTSLEKRIGASATLVWKRAGASFLHVPGIPRATRNILKLERGEWKD